MRQCTVLLIVFICGFPDLAFAYAEEPSAPTLSEPAHLQSPVSITTSAAVPITESAQELAPNVLGNVDDFENLDLGSMMDVLGDKLDSNVSSASTSREPISKAPASIDVMTREMLYQLGARDLYAALSYLPGVEVVGSYVGSTVLVFRGQLQENYNNKILLLINGFPVLEPANSSFHLESVPMDSVDRIEVIRGPGSVMYGTNAYAGVINVLTRNREIEGSSNTLRAEGGSFMTAQGGAGHWGKSGDLAWSVFTSGQKTDGHPNDVAREQNEDCVTGEPAGAGDCPATGKSFSFNKLNNYATGLGELRFRGLRLQIGGMDQKRMKYGIVPNARFHGPDYTTHVFAGAGYVYEWNTVSISARGSFNREGRDWRNGRFPLPRFAPSTLNSIGLVYTSDLRLAWRPVKTFVLDQGIGAVKGSTLFFKVKNLDGPLHPLAPNINHDPQNRTFSYYAQGSWQIIPALTLIGGDRISTFQSSAMRVTLKGGVPTSRVVNEEPIWQNAPRAGVVFTPVENLSFKMLYGEAFRMPNIYETTALLNQVIGSTLEIMPEVVRTGELAFDARPVEWMNVRGTGYYSVLENTIGRRAPENADEIARFGAKSTLTDNLAGQKIVGAEVGSQAVVSDQWSLFANAGWKIVRDNDGNRVHDVSPLSANAGVSYQPLEWLALRPNAQYVGARGRLNAYSLLNAVVDFPVTRRITISLIGTNLLDARYDYPEYVRRVVASIPGGPGIAGFGRVVAEF